MRNDSSDTCGVRVNNKSDYWFPNEKFIRIHTAGSFFLFCVQYSIQPKKTTDIYPKDSYGTDTGITPEFSLAINNTESYHDQ